MKGMGIVLLALAALLLVWGLDASGSIQSEFTRLFRGGPSDRTVWLFAGSAVAGIMGLGLLFSGRSRTT